MPGPYELQFGTKVTGAEALSALEGILRKVHESGKVSALSLSEFEEKVRKGIESGKSLQQVLGTISANSKEFGKEVSRAASIGATELKQLETQAKRTAQEISKSQLEAASGISNALKSAATGDVAAVFRSIGDAGGNAFNTIALTAGAAGAVIGGLTAAAIGFVDAQGDIAEKTLNFADRTGIAVGEVERLKAAAQIAGVNINTLEASSRLLANALEDSSATGKKAQGALHELGVSARTSQGQVREMGVVTLEALEALSRIPDTSKRVELANQLLGRGAKELQPLIKNFEELQEAVKKLGIGLNEDGTKRLAEANDEMDKLRISLAQLKKEAAEKIAPIVVPIIRVITDVVSGKAGPKNAPEAAGIRGLASVGNNNAEDIGKDVRAAVLNPETNLALAQFQAQERALQELQSKAYRESLKTTEEGRKARIAELRKEIADRDAILTSANTDRPTRVRVQSEVDERRKELSVLENQKKVNNEILTLREQLASLQAKELSGIAKINAEYSAQVAKLKERNEFSPEAAVLTEKIRSEKIIQFARERATQDNQIARQLEAEQARIAEQGERDRQSRVEKIRAARGKVEDQSTDTINTAFAERARIAQQEYEIAIQSAAVRRLDLAEQLSRSGNILQFQKDIAKVQEDEGRAEAQRQKELDDAALAGIVARINLRKQESIEAQAAAAEERNIRRVSEKSEFDNLKTTVELRQRLRAAQAPSGNEPALEIASLRERAAIAQQEYNITKQRIAEDKDAARALFNIDNDKKKLNETLAKLRIEGIQAAATLEEEQTRARLDAEIKIAEIRKKQADDFGESVGKAFDAANTRGADGLREYVKTFGQGIERTIAVNLGKEAFTSLRDTFKLGQIIPGQTKQGENGTELTTLGRILKGTPLGVDPAKLATDANTAATINNTTALLNLSAVYGGRAAAGTVSAITGGASSASPIFSGSLGGGIFNAVSGTSSLPQIQTFPTPVIPGLDTAAGTASKSSGLFSARNIGTAAGVGLGAFNAFQGFKNGNIGQGVAGVLGTAAVLDPEPISKTILAIGALVAPLFGGNGKANRDKELTTEIENNRYQPNTSLDLSFDSGTGGNLYDYDTRGRIRGSEFSNFPVNVRQPARYQFDGNYVDVPGQQLAPFDSRDRSSPPPVNVYVSTMDAKSFMDNADKIAPVVQGIVANHQPTQEEIRRQTVNR